LLLGLCIRYELLVTFTLVYREITLQGGG